MIEARRRRSPRLRDYDYSQSGAYFVTVVTRGRRTLFGEVVDGEMRPSEAGAMAQAVWDALPRKFPSVEADVSVVMPNHIHGILFFDRPAGSTGRRHPSAAAGHPAPKLGAVIGAYKSLTTVRYAHGVRTAGWPPFDRHLWQRSYYDRVIRNEHELDNIREYIVNNPMQWQLDEENPDVYAES